MEERIRTLGHVEMRGGDVMCELPARLRTLSSKGLGRPHALAGRPAASLITSL